MDTTKEKLYRALADATFEAVFISEKGVCIDINEGATEIFGYSHDELIGIFGTDVIADESKALVRENMLSGYEEPYEVVARRKNGETFHALVRGKMMEFDGKSVRVTVVRDIDAQKKAEERLQQNEEKYRMMVSLQTDLVVTIDPAGHILFANPSMCKAFGKNEDEMCGLHYLALMHEEDRPRAELTLETLFGPPHQNYVELRTKTVQGLRWFGWLVRSALDVRGEVTAIHCVGRDITGLKLASTHLQKEKQKFQILVEESPFAASLIAPDGRYLYLNPKFEELFGYTLDDIPTGKRWFEQAYPDPERRREAVRAWKEKFLPAEKGVTSMHAFNVHAKDGSQKLINFRPVTISDGSQLVLYEDITLQTQMEARLAHSARMEAVGTLAGGVAHDFNNLLQAITGYGELLLDNLEVDSPASRHVDKILTASASATKLVQNLLAFSRNEKPDLKPVDVNQLIKSALGILSRTIPKMVGIRTSLIEDLWVVNGDFAQLEQVVINLGTNARDAMPDGGTLTIETENVNLDETFCENTPGIKPGDYVFLRITDTGTGIGSEDAQQVFDPFFTTKKIGKGTGLGLSTAYGIVKTHGGHMAFESGVGEGTSFSIYLPALHIGPLEYESTLKTERETPTGTETILLVDDEKMIIELATTALETYGYKVLCANSGEEALDVYKAHADEIDLVLLDLGMPGMGGLKCMRKLQALDPGLKMAVATGYSLDAQREELQAAGALDILSKPYKLPHLGTAVRRLLDG